MQGSKKIPINDLNQYITCKICKGYFVDATTIIECLHTFCRSCIVEYLQTNKYCPVCDVQVHKSKPLLNIRPDKTLQDVVYKLVPRLFRNEMQRRRDFYSSHPETKPSSLEQCGETSYQHLLTPEETVCLTLSYHGSNSNPRYLRCPAAVSLSHLQKLIRAKYGLKETHRVDILYNQDCLNSSLTLMDVAYIYLWKRKGPIELTYRIYECAVTNIKIEHDLSDESPAPVNCVINNNNNINNNNWKEVQLRISENGEMSITGIDTNLHSSLLEIVNSEPKYKNEMVTVVQNASNTTNVTNNDNDAEIKSCEKGNSVLPETLNTTVQNEIVNTLNDISDTVNTSCTSSTVTLNIPILGISESRPSEIPLQHIASSSACLSSATTTTVYSTISKSKCSTKTDDTSIKVEQNSIGLQENGTNSLQKSEITEVTKEEKIVQITSENVPEVSVMCNNVPKSTQETNLKRKLIDTSESEPPCKQSKQVLNHSVPLLNLSNNHPLKKHSKINHNGKNVKNSSPKVIILENDIIVPSSSVTSGLRNDISSAKQVILNKTMPITYSTKPCSPVALSKAIMSTKASIIPPKLPSTTYAGQKPLCYMPKTTYSPVLNVPKPLTVNASITNNLKTDVSIYPCSTSSNTATTSKTDTKPLNISCPQQVHISNSNNKPQVKTKSTTPIGYKTLRDPPKSWNSQISKANFNKTSSPDPKYSDMKNVRPKFFKMRNNMPRYLGAPASGVKPMYQVHVSPEKEKLPETNKQEKSEIKKHSIVKIDPKTLKPISEKAPETSSLSNHSLSNSGLPISHSNSVTQIFSSPPIMTNHSLNNLQTELKINTSSVSIFNPLKLQSSPKNDRKSPKSPQSPKLKSTSSPTTSTANSANNKRDKVNVTFTPPNPFVPRLASPSTLGPGQFLYPPPAYDPRVMAAYTSLWYGQRLAGFPGGVAGLPHPGLGLDLNSQITQQQRKSFELLAAAHTAQMVAKSTPIPAPSISPISRLPNLPSVPKPVSTSKKKESKNEKSLETTLEKLTQNRHKEFNCRTEMADEAKRTPNRPDKSESKRKDNPEPFQISGSHTEVSQQNSSHNRTSNSKSSVQSPSNNKTNIVVPSSEVKNSSSSESATQIKVNESPASKFTSSSEKTESAPVVSCSKTSEDGFAKCLSTDDVKSERTLTNENPISQCNSDSVKLLQCTEMKVGECSGSQSVQRNNDLSDNKISEKIVEGGE